MASSRLQTILFMMVFSSGAEISMSWNTERRSAGLRLRLREFGEEASEPGVHLFVGHGFLETITTATGIRVSLCFSENTRMQKSPLRCGSKVEGTTRYSPGGSLKRVLTSRRLVKVSDLAVCAWVRKKFLSRWTSLCP
ncbi:hypothetical protein EYF80_064824 [Liparis tanakae]|uniref:Secreted protein n=1 Tax=Liparis tanakae TaxID=230148 RepID=A0A4Z2E903_9TELE|nr:hypothetical protein EYF80_064824 [Liparis tanakae]